MNVNAGQMWPAKASFTSMTHKGKTASFTVSERHMLNIKAVKLQALTASQVVFTCSSIKNRTNRKYAFFYTWNCFLMPATFLITFGQVTPPSKLTQTHRWKEDLPMNGHILFCKRLNPVLVLPFLSPILCKNHITNII